MGFARHGGTLPQKYTLYRPPIAVRAVGAVAHVQYRTSIQARRRGPAVDAWERLGGPPAHHVKRQPRRADTAGRGSFLVVEDAGESVLGAGDHLLTAVEGWAGASRRASLRAVRK